MLAGVIILALAAGSAGIAWGVMEYRTNWADVVPGRIYRSAQIPALLIRHKLKANQIRTIIFLSHDDENDADIQAEKQTAAELGADFLNFPMSGDGLAPPQQYTDALRALLQSVRSGKAALVHCHSGAQRTGGVIAVYRLLVEKKPPADVLAEMLRHGHDPRKNTALVPFLNQNMGQWAAALQADGSIDRIPDPLPQLHP
jgi:protein tyrosine/serine phosphatase